MLTQSWAVYFISLALLLGSTSANPIRIYEAEESDITPSNPLLPRVVCSPCTASQAEYIYPTEMTGADWTWKRKCIDLCKAGTTLQLDPKTKKYDCMAANCKRAGPTACTLPECNPKTEDMFKGKCLPKCKTPMVRNPTTGQCGAETGGTTGAVKCTATQELLNGKCVAKCKPPMVRNATGKCAAATTTTTTTKCTAAQELFKGKCVAKCKAPKRRTAAGACK